MFAIMNPQNTKLVPSLNFFGVGLYSCCDVLQSQQSQSKGRSSLPPLDTGSESNLIIGSAASWNNQLRFAWKQAIGLKISRSIKDNKGKRPSAILSKFLILCGVDCNWQCVFSVLEKFRFLLSTRTRENSVLKKFHSVECFRKIPFSLIVFIRYVWTEAVSVKKKLRFQMKTDTCRQGLRLNIMNK